MPWWVWALILGLGAITPICHYWVAHYPPASGAFTGLRTVDDSQFRHSMRMFFPDFRSPYVLPISPCKPNFLPPSGLAWTLGALGEVGHALGVDEFFFLGLINGISGMLYLFAVYAFLREFAPRQANLAFCLHTLGGGLAGIVFISSTMTGWSHSPGFENWFYRFSQRELYEGVTLNPLTMFPRIYYTLSLAGLFSAIALLHRFCRDGKSHRLAAAGVLAFAGAFINLRYGAPMCILVLIWLLCASGYSVRLRLLVGATMGIAVVLGSLASVITIALNAAVMGNQLDIRDSVGLSSLLFAGLWHVFAAPIPCLQALRRLPFAPRLLAYSLAGWLAAFIVLFLGYNLCSGSVLSPGRFTTAIWSADRAFVGAALGAWLAMRGRGHPVARTESTDWIAVGFLLFLVASIGPFFGGAYLRLTPSRLLIIASVPLSILSAMGVQMIRARTQLVAYTLTGAFILFGVCSQAVSLLYYLGPAGWYPGSDPQYMTQFSVMSEADAESIECLGEGTVFSTPRFGDIISVRNDRCTVIGISSMALSGVPWKRVQDDMEDFFSSITTDSARRALVERYGVNYVYCPDTTPFPVETIAALQNTSWLRQIKQLGRAYVFQVADVSGTDSH